MEPQALSSLIALLAKYLNWVGTFADSFIFDSQNVARVKLTIFDISFYRSHPLLVGCALPVVDIGLKQKLKSYEHRLSICKMRIYIAFYNERHTRRLSIHKIQFDCSKIFRLAKLKFVSRCQRLFIPHERLAARGNLVIFSFAHADVLSVAIFKLI